MYAYHLRRTWYNDDMMTKPLRTLELHYPMIQLLLKKKKQKTVFELPFASPSKKYLELAKGLIRRIAKQQRQQQTLKTTMVVCALYIYKDNIEELFLFLPLPSAHSPPMPLFHSFLFPSLPFCSVLFSSLLFPPIPFSSLLFPSLLFHSLPFSSLFFTSLTLSCLTRPTRK